MSLSPSKVETFSYKEKISFYLELSKPKITRTVILTVLLGYFARLPVSLFATSAALGGLVLTLVSASLVCTGACALNHVLEYKSDGLMQRTKRRPLPMGHISKKAALNFSYGTALLGALMMAVFISPFMAIGALLTLVLYTHVYTPLKKHTKWNTTIGALPGALPVLGGSVAATQLLGMPLAFGLEEGSVLASFLWGVSPATLCIFAILILWQHPHFYAIAWICREDYQRASYVMIAKGDSHGRMTFGMALFFALCTMAFTLLLPRYLLELGYGYKAVSLLLGLIFIGLILQALIKPSDLRARRVLLYSVFYLSLWIVIAIGDMLL